ncbi:YfgM family protein [Photobacterium galatheae]|uniref:Ancillary SecYEG translocon subunit n=1 Tax=Photobacterium galatheae TaxID=1654360 RepID=A0A066RNA3_9GAMM|nr:tetratricopeptide repeat protein [Photobacterium galatheae]KDM91940.1 membrane protein [Photobacterium galatheae]MCM0147646.1 tetratricopeptide repeat protein [Photobacterium galatheae]
MDVNTTEEQQVEIIKAWLKENGKAVVLGAVLGLGGLYGWRYYQAEVQTAKEQASEAYTQTVQALSSGDDGAMSQAQTFIHDFESSHYAVLTALQLAKVQIEKNDLDAAAAQLKWAIGHTEDDALLSVAHTRLARILAAQKSYDEALAELDKVKAESWKGKVAELRGDILLQKGDQSAAREAYLRAKELGASPALQIKLDDLAQ